VYIGISTLKMITIEEPVSAFNQTALSNWVEACNADGALRASGASQEEILNSQINIITGLANLIAPSSFDNNDIMGLIGLLMLQNTNSITNNTITEDPIPDILDSPISDSDTDEAQ
jgi:hypothetical protein